MTYGWTTEWKIREDWFDKKHWFIAALDLAMGENHNLSLSVGSRPKGKGLRWISLLWTDGR